jgi:hypothetical protein
VTALPIIAPYFLSEKWCVLWKIYPFYESTTRQKCSTLLAAVLWCLHMCVKMRGRNNNNNNNSRSQWPRSLRRKSTAARLLRSWVRIPPGAWMSVCCDCCVLSGRGLCDAQITRPEESYRLWCVVVCDLEKQTSWMSRPRPTRRLWREEKIIIIIP